MTDIYFWQQSAWQRFLTTKRQQKIAHAVTLCGVNGLGKFELSLNMAKAILCLTPNDDGSQCNNCHSCQLFEAGNHPDHLVIEPEEDGKQIKIEQIRQLKEKQQLTPTISRWKTVIINPADMMNVNANNSLLKLLEEPEANTFMVLVTAKFERLPITVRSRCQQIHLKTPAMQETTQWLIENGNQIQKDALFDQYYSLANGAPLTIAELVESDSIIQFQQINNDLDTLFKQRINPIEMAAVWLNFDLPLLMQQCYLVVHQKMIERFKSRLNNMDNVSNIQHWQIVDCIVETTKLISSQNNLNKQLLLERFLVELNTILHLEVK
jgi:DNA polymerase-3 subunit delta'